jgi:hypothetical protein
MIRRRDKKSDSKPLLHLGIRVHIIHFCACLVYLSQAHIQIERERCELFEQRADDFCAIFSLSLSPRTESQSKRETKEEKTMMDITIIM